MSSVKLICLFVLFVAIKAGEDHCPPPMGLVGINCLMLGHIHYREQAQAKIFCAGQTKDGRKGRLFLPTTKAHLAAAIAFANERNPGIQHLWTGWEKDPATKTVISSSRPGLTMPESLWVRPTEPNYPLRMSSSLQGGKYKEGCVVAVASGVGDVDCVTWARIMHRNPYAICEFF